MSNDNRDRKCPPFRRYTEDEQPAVDQYTLWHAASGAALGLMGASLPTVAVVAVSWEVAENPLKRAAPELFPDSCGDRTANATLDAAAMIGGWALVRALSEDEEGP